MYKPIFVIAFLCLIFLGCSKEEEREPAPQVISEEPVSVLDHIEEEFGVTISDKDKLSEINIRYTGSIITVNASKNDKPIALVIDTKGKKVISQFTFSDELITAKLPYGEIRKMSHGFLEIYQKTDTHLYGVIRHKQDGSMYFSYASLFVAEIKNSKIVESDPVNSSVEVLHSFPFKFRRWYEDMLLITVNTEYRVVDIGNKTIHEGDHEETLAIDYLNRFADFVPITPSKAIGYDGGNSLSVFDIEDNTNRSIYYNPRDNENDRVEVVSITSDGEKIATVKFKLTTYEGIKSEKTVKVDFVDYQIVE